MPVFGVISGTMSDGGGGAISTGSANIAIHAAVISIAARTFWPSAAGMCKSPRVGPWPKTKPKYTTSSNTTLPA